MATDFLAISPTRFTISGVYFLLLASILLHSNNYVRVQFVQEKAIYEPFLCSAQKMNSGIGTRRGNIMLYHYAAPFICANKGCVHVPTISFSRKLIIKTIGCSKFFSLFSPSENLWLTNEVRYSI